MNAAGNTRARAGPLDSPWLPTLISAAAYLLFLLVRLQIVGWNPYAFITAGDVVCNPAQVPKGLQVLKDNSGYDGQYYYRLALDPFTKKRCDFGITLYDHAYRQQRIIYPLLTWASSLGRPERVPISLIAVNFLGVCAIAWLGACIAQSLGWHALWGLALSLYPGFMLTLARDLAEIVQITFLLATFLFLRRGRPVGATICLILAILTKEPSLVVVVAAAMVWAEAAWRKSDAPRPPWYFIATPLLVFGLWQLALWARWGQVPMATTSGHLGVPFRGFIECFLLMRGLDSPRHVIHLFEFYLLGAAAVAAACALPSSSATRLEKTAWMLYAVLGVMATNRIWIEDWSFMRVFSEFYVLSALIIIGAHSPLKSAVFGTAGAIWVALLIARE